MTEDEQQSIAAFLQSLAVSLSNFFDQGPLEERTLENFRIVLRGYLGEFLSHPPPHSPAVQYGARQLLELLEREIERMPLHRLRETDPKH